MKDEYDFSKGTRGAILSTEGMTRIQLYIKDETFEGLRRQAEQAGIGYQTLVNGILKKHLESEADISDLSLESLPLNKEHPMWRSHQKASMPARQTPDLAQ